MQPDRGCRSPDWATIQVAIRNLDKLVDGPIGIGLAKSNAMVKILRKRAYLFTSYRNATAPEPKSSRPTSFRSTILLSPANKVGPRPTIRG